MSCQLFLLSYLVYKINKIYSGCSETSVLLWSDELPSFKTTLTKFLRVLAWFMLFSLKLFMSCKPWECLGQREENKICVPACESGSTLHRLWSRPEFPGGGNKSINFSEVGSIHLTCAVFWNALIWPAAKNLSPAVCAILWQLAAFLWLFSIFVAKAFKVAFFQIMLFLFPVLILILECPMNIQEVHTFS